MKVTKIEVLEAELSGQNGIASWHHVFARVSCTQCGGRPGW